MLCSCCFNLPCRLFGPKRKMTSAIARWHSSAGPPGDALELAYADRLEAEMQELAIQLHRVSDLKSGIMGGSVPMEGKTWGQDSAP